MNKITKILIFIIFSIIDLNAQDIKVINGDTLIIITPRDMRVINSVFSENKNLNNELLIIQSIINEQRNIISDRDTIISRQKITIESMSKLNETSKETIKSLNEQFIKEKKRKKIYGIGGLLGGFGLACLILL